MQHAASTLRKIFRETVSREGEQAPVLAWPLACGSKIAERARALTFSGGTLTVAVPDVTWRRQLESFTPQYLAAINQMIPEKVNRIDFVIDNATAR